MFAPRTLCLLSLLTLAGCGFHPIYGAHGDDDAPVAMDLNNIAIETTYDTASVDSTLSHNSQILRNDLIDRMYGHNRPEHPLYHLKIKVHYNEEDLGILANATATESELNMYGDYVLTDGQNKELVRGIAHSVAGFEKLDQMYGTVAARQSAYQNTIHEVSEQIVNRLSLFFAERK